MGVDVPFQTEGLRCSDTTSLLSAIGESVTWYGRYQMIQTSLSLFVEKTKSVYSASQYVLDRKVYQREVSHL